MLPRFWGKFAFYLYYQGYNRLKKWKEFVWKRNLSIFTSCYFSLRLNANISCLNLLELQRALNWQRISQPTWFNNGSRQGWLRGVLWEISPTQSVPLASFYLFPWFWLSPYWQLSISLAKQDLLTAHYTYMGQILLSFSAILFCRGRPLLASFSSSALSTISGIFIVSLLLLWRFWLFSLNCFCIKPAFEKSLP